MASLALRVHQTSLSAPALSLRPGTSTAQRRVSVIPGRRSIQARASMACATVEAGPSCHLAPELVAGTACQLSPALVEGASCEMVPDLVLGPSCALTAADVGVEDAAVPTPVLPSGNMMAEFFAAYRRMLEHECRSGDEAAQAGESVIECVRVGLDGLLHHPLHGASTTSPSWLKGEHEVEACLWELEKDMWMFHKYHERRPAPIAVALTGMHCTEAARLLRRL